MLKVEQGTPRNPKAGIEVCKVYGTS